MFSRFARSFSSDDRTRKSYDGSYQSFNAGERDLPTPTRDWCSISQRITSERVRDGCLIPTPGEALETAVKALSEKTDSLTSPVLQSTERHSVLLGLHHNNVPESLVVSCMSNDVHDGFMQRYMETIQRCLDDLKLSGDGLWWVYENTYWQYLKYTTGAEVPVTSEKVNKKSKSTVLLFSSVVANKPISRHPFKSKVINSDYRGICQELREALGAVQKYMYFMRPDDPTNPSPDTRIRVQEIAAYTATGYGWMLWFLDVVDARVCRHLKLQFRRIRGPRASVIPDDLLRRHLKTGPAVSAGTGVAFILAATTASALTALLRISVLWRKEEWRDGLNGTAAAIVAAVELITLLHHHFQYLINMMLIGYACWGDGGLNDPYILKALRAQGRFLYFAGQLVRTMSTHSWVVLETSTHMWFSRAVAQSILAHGGKPTKYYAQVLAASKRYTPLHLRRISEPSSVSDQPYIRFNRLGSPIGTGIGNLECVCLTGNYLSDDVNASSHVINTEAPLNSIAPDTNRQRTSRVLVRPDTGLDVTVRKNHCLDIGHTDGSPVDPTYPDHYTRIKAEYEGPVRDESNTMFNQRSDLRHIETQASLNDHVYENIPPKEVGFNSSSDPDVDSLNGYTSGDMHTDDDLSPDFIPNDVPVRCKTTVTFRKNTPKSHH